MDTSVSNDMYLIRTKIDLCIQPNLKTPSKINPKVKLFILNYNKKGFKYILLQYKVNTILIKIKNKINNILRLKLL